MSKTKKLILSAVMASLSFALVLASKLLPSPWTQGGSITIASMTPIILASILLGTKWGILSGLVFSLIQMITGFYLPPVTTFLTFIAVILLDYILPFSVLGLAGFFAKLTGNKIWSIPLSGTIVTFLRYILHTLSGIIIWGAFTDAESVPIYSIVYNGSYMIPEIIITTTVLAVIAPKINNKFNL